MLEKIFDLIEKKMDILYFARMRRECAAKLPREAEMASDEYDWMEIPIPRNISRREVHKRVDEWLDDRDAGRT